MFSLKTRDWLKGFIMAVGTPVLYLLQEMIPNWPLNALEKAALSAAVTYLLKNFFTNDVKAAEKVLQKEEEKKQTHDAFRKPKISMVGNLIARRYTYWRVFFTSPIFQNLKQLQMKKLTLILSLALIVSATFAQNPFKRLPKHAATTVNAKNLKYGVTVTATDSVFNAFRFVTNIAAYAYPGNIAMAGAGLSYQHLDYNFATQKYTCKWSVSGMMWAGGSLAPKTPTEAVSFGVLFGAFNNLIMVGPALNGGKAQAVVSIGINLNN